MSLFQCECCGCVENTATSEQGFRLSVEDYDWSYAPEREGKRLCSECGPTHYKGGQKTEFGGQWHGMFRRRYLPLGEFKTSKNGNLEHIATGSTDIASFELPHSEPRK